MYHLKSSQEMPQLYKYMISLEKCSEHWKFFVEEKQIYVTLMEILKNYCVMSNFENEYETMSFLGTGHFAQVFCVKNRTTKKIFAAKIFRKDDNLLEKNKVNYFFIYILNLSRI